MASSEPPLPAPLTSNAPPPRALARSRAPSASRTSRPPSRARQREENSEPGPSRRKHRRASESSEEEPLQRKRAVVERQVEPKPEEPPRPPMDAPLLSTYTCPICFSPPTNATLTPCGHVCCGSCLFTAVKSALRRATGDDVARCPVCRAQILNWDGKGGGVVGLKIRTAVSL